MHTRHPKQHVSKQSCSNVQLSSKDVLSKKVYVLPHRDRSRRSNLLSYSATMY